jgi:DNA-cytosine methyltransferase
LGFQWAGFRIGWQCEIGADERAVLEARWPGVPKWKDVRTFPRAPSGDFRAVDVIAGGFPCTNISTVARLDYGCQTGLDGEHSGLWFEMLDVIRGWRPRAVVVENVAALLTVNEGRDFGRILWSLDRLGYGYEWQVVRAADAKLPQRRRRLFILAYADAGAAGTGGQWRMPKGKTAPWPRLVHAGRGGGADGVPAGLDRYPRVVRAAMNRRRAMIGNAVPPPVAEIVARRVRQVLGR